MLSDRSHGPSVTGDRSLSGRGRETARDGRSCLCVALSPLYEGAPDWWVQSAIAAMPDQIAVS